MEIHSNPVNVFRRVTVASRHGNPPWRHGIQVVPLRHGAGHSVCEVNMKSRWSPLLSLLLSLFPVAVLAQTPVIRSIDPSAGPTSGGTLVAITGDELGADVACILPCPPRVTFDNTTVDGEFQSNTVIVARTPAHAAGVVDVKVQTP